MFNLNQHFIMNKYILMFTVLLCCCALSLHAEKKKRIFWPEHQGTTSNPKSPSGNTVPFLMGEYDSDTLSISIGEYWGDATVYIIAIPSNTIMDSDSTSVVFQTQMDFSLSGYAQGTTYQAIIILNDDEVYVGEFDL